MVQLVASLPVAPWEIPLTEYDHAEKAVKKVREAVGNKADICIGTHGQITPATSRRLAKRIEPYDPLWLEEPCPPENFKEMAKIAQSTSIPIATGERLVTIHDFQKLFEEGACAIAQPDPGSCGGITACKQIATLAEAHYVLMAPHVWGGPIITAAALQIDGVPIVAMSARHDRIDNFWFTLMHEIAHVYLHQRMGLETGFYDDLDESGNDQVEDEADEFASSTLIPAEVWNRSPARISKDHIAIDRFAENLGIHPAIVFGRVRKERNNYKIFHDRVGLGCVRNQLNQD